MYGVVLMAALTVNTADAPKNCGFAFGRAIGCCGGLYLHSGMYSSCMGCWGGAYSNGCGCSGYWAGPAPSCYGCMGCYGAYGTGYAGGVGNYTGWFGSNTGWYGPEAAAFYGYGAATNQLGGQTGVTFPGNNPMQASANPSSVPSKDSKPTSARLTIEKPADAKLFVDDQPIRADGTRNSFSTPSLTPGQAYYYMVRVEMVRNGKPVSESRRVVLTAGDNIKETFQEAATQTAAR